MTKIRITNTDFNAFSEGKVAVVTGCDTDWGRDGVRLAEAGCIRRYNIVEPTKLLRASPPGTSFLSLDSRSASNRWHSGATERAVTEYGHFIVRE